MSAAPVMQLDETVASVRRSLEARRVAAPDALYLLATGVEGLCEELRHAIELPLGELEGVPEPWQSRVLHAGRLGRSSLWLLEDAAGEPPAEPVEGVAHAAQAPWVTAFPVWLAASAGAEVLVHASAGTALPPPDGGHVEREGLALVRDHLNLSGRTPLLGLAESRLGPLFPDLSRLHHIGLRRAALDTAERLGSRAYEAVVACTAGPSLETPAERRWLARSGAEVAVQSLAAPLLAAGHAGLAVLAVVAVVEAGDEASDVARLLERATALAPRLDGLLAALDRDVERAVTRLRQEDAPSR